MLKKNKKDWMFCFVNRTTESIKFQQFDAYTD